MPTNRQIALRRVRRAQASLRSALRALRLIRLAPSDGTVVILCDPSVARSVRRLSRLRRGELVVVPVTKVADDGEDSSRADEDLDRLLDDTFLRVGPISTIIDDSQTYARNLPLSNPGMLRLSAGGQYVIHRVAPAHGGPTAKDAILGPAAIGAGDWRDSIHDVDARKDRFVLTKAGSHYVTFMEDQLTPEMLTRVQWPWASAVDVEGARSYTSLAVLSCNRPGLMGRFASATQLPVRRIRTYRDVVCAQGQLVLRDGVLLPESFRQYRQPRPTSTLVRRITDRLVVLKNPLDEPKPLRGSYFHLDSEYVEIYGHLVTEVVSRLWAWDRLKAADPELSVLVAAPSGEADIPTWFRQTLNAYGIDDADITVITSPVTVEKLHSATPLFTNPHIVHPAIVETWSRLRDNLIALCGDATPVVGKRIFISRPNDLTRRCHQADEILELFMRHGFEVFHPEDWSVHEQAWVFANADIIAGYGGSGMLNMIYGRHGQTSIVIAPETYNAMNEYLIASALQGNVHYFWGSSDIQHPAGGWSEKAFKSDFSFHLDGEGKDLAPLLDSLTRTNS